MLPIGPTSFGNSPYQSYSAFAGNPYLIDLDDLVKDGLLQETEIRSFNWGTDDADIDYATIYENRYKILRMAFSRFSAESEDFLAFTEKSDSWLSDYSLYTALKRHFGDIEWQSWDVPLRDRDQEAVKEYQEILHNDIMFCKFCQYEFFKGQTIDSSCTGSSVHAQRGSNAGVCRSSSAAGKCSAGAAE